MHKTLFTIFLFATLITFAHAQSSSNGLPTEEDTVVIGRSVVLQNISGEVLRQVYSGALVPVESGTIIKPGERILVRKGAFFSIGRTTFGPESHGDRWVIFR